MCTKIAPHVFRRLGSFGDAVHASLRGTAQFSMVMTHVRYFGFWRHPQKLQAKGS